MQETNKALPRKKFLWLTGATILSAGILRMFTIKRTPKEKADKVKMLAQDGSLVEVDRKLVEMHGKKISNKELQQWIKTKPATK